jgi:ribosomal protein L11 methyltransferase
VWATDNDPQALIATNENAERNQVVARIHATLPNQEPQQPADVLLANILAGPLVTLAPRFGKLLRPGGALVLSGILADQAEEVRDAYLAEFHMDPPQLLDGWVRLTGTRN